MSPPPQSKTPLYQQLLPHPKWRCFLIALALILPGVISVERAVRGSSDFRGFHAIWAANAISSYQPSRQTGEHPSDPDPYPPTSYPLFAPLGYLPILPAAILWYFLNLAASFLAWKGLERLAESPLGKTRTGLYLFISVAPFWIGNLLSGQNGPILIALVIWGYVFAWRNLPRLAGTLLAIASLIKAVPVLFLLPFFNRRDFRVVVTAVAIALIWILGVCSLYFGPRTNLLFQQRWLSMVIRGPDGLPADPYRAKTMHSSPRYGNQASEAVLARLLLDIPAGGSGSSFRVNFIDLGVPRWRSIRTVFTLTILLITVIYLQKITSNPSPLSALSLLTLTLLLISPIVWTHYYLWMIIPILYQLVALSPNSEGLPSRIPWLLILWWIGELGLASPWLRAVGLHFWLVLLFFVIQSLTPFLSPEKPR